MDKYGIINLTELEKAISDYIHKRDGWKDHTQNWEVYDLMIRELSDIKDHCFSLPLASEVFNAGRYADEIENPTTAVLTYGYIYNNFDDYLEQFKNKK